MKASKSEILEISLFRTRAQSVSRYENSCQGKETSHQHYITLTWVSHHSGSHRRSDLSGADA